MVRLKGFCLENNLVYLARFNSKKVILVDQSETPLFFLENEIRGKFVDMKFQILLADVTNYEKMDQIFIIDFGLCKKYLINGGHIPMKEGKKLVGTPMFCSLNTHAGIFKLNIIFYSYFLNM